MTWRAALVAALALGAPAQAQEAVARFAAEGTQTSELLIRSTTDIAIVEPALDAFVALYPAIAITYEQWGSNPLYDVTLAACGGEGIPADVVISSGVHQMVDLVNRACASPYASAATAALPAARRWRDEIWGITQEAAVIIYNTALVPADEAPHTRFALLDLMRRPSSDYRGKIATYDIEASGLGYLFAFIDSQEATTFGGLLEGFARVDAVATCCSAEIIQGVEEGRYKIAYNVLGSYVTSAPHKNIGVIYPEDYTFILSRALIIPKVAPHPGDAALLLDFLLSEEGQAISAASNMVLPRDDDEIGLAESARRYIPLDPKLLVALDQQRRMIFVDQWRATFAAGREP